MKTLADDVPGVPQTPRQIIDSVFKEQMVATVQRMKSFRLKFYAGWLLNREPTNNDLAEIFIVYDIDHYRKKHPIQIRLDPSTCRQPYFK